MPPGYAAEAACLEQLDIEATGEVLHLLGLIAERRGRPREAVEWVERALDTEPERVEAHTTLAALYFGRGQATRALAHLDEAIALDHGYVLAHKNLAGIYWSRGETALALKAFETCLQLSPNGTDCKQSIERIRAR